MKQSDIKVLPQILCECDTSNFSITITISMTITCSVGWSYSHKCLLVIAPYALTAISVMNIEHYTGSARHLETWNTPGYLFGFFQDLENLEK